MKHILIIVPYLGVGGTLSSLNAFLENVNPDELKVDVFARKRTGAYLDVLPNCTILKENVLLSSKLYKSNALKKLMNFILVATNFFLSKVKLSILPILCRIGGAQINSTSYDAILAYQENLSSFLSYLPARKRICWVRSEYERYISLCGNIDETKYYRAIDTVVAVSEFAKKSFLKIHPWHSNVVKINNFMNIEAVREKAKDKSQIVSEFQKGDFTIVSIGRLDPVKQFEKIPTILHSVLERTKKDVRWYIVGGSRKGGGKSEKIMRYEIVKLHLQDNLHLLPETSNPYAYLAEADLFVHTSKSETYSRVVAEAKSVGTPVVVNNYEAAFEFIKDGEEGYIVPIDLMTDKIVFLCDNIQVLNRFKGNLQKYSWPNKEIIDQTMSII